MFGLLFLFSAIACAFSAQLLANTEAYKGTASQLFKLTKVDPSDGTKLFVSFVSTDTQSVAYICRNTTAQEPSIVDCRKDAIFRIYGDSRNENTYVSDSDKTVYSWFIYVESTKNIDYTLTNGVFIPILPYETANVTSSLKKTYYFGAFACEKSTMNFNAVFNDFSLTGVSISACANNSLANDNCVYDKQTANIDDMGVWMTFVPENAGTWVFFTLTLSSTNGTPFSVGVDAYQDFSVAMAPETTRYREILYDSPFCADFLTLNNIDINKKLLFLVEPNEIKLVENLGVKFIYDASQKKDEKLNPLVVFSATELASKGIVNNSFNVKVSAGLGDFSSQEFSLKPITCASTRYQAFFSQIVDVMDPGKSVIATASVEEIPNSSRYNWNDYNMVIRYPMATIMYPSLATDANLAIMAYENYISLKSADPMISFSRFFNDSGSMKQGQIMSTGVGTVSQVVVRPSSSSIYPPKGSATVAYGRLRAIAPSQYHDIDGKYSIKANVMAGVTWPLTTPGQSLQFQGGDSQYTFFNIPLDFSRLSTLEHGLKVVLTIYDPAFTDDDFFIAASQKFVMPVFDELMQWVVKEKDEELSDKKKTVFKLAITSKEANEFLKSSSYLYLAISTTKKNSMEITFEDDIFTTINADNLTDTHFTSTSAQIKKNEGVTLVLEVTAEQGDNDRDNQIDVSAIAGIFQLDKLYDSSDRLISFDNQKVAGCKFSLYPYFPPASDNDFHDVLIEGLRKMNQATVTPSSNYAGFENSVGSNTYTVVTNNGAIKIYFALKQDDVKEGTVCEYSRASFTFNAGSVEIIGSVKESNSFVIDSKRDTVVFSYPVKPNVDASFTLGSDSCRLDYYLCSEPCFTTDNRETNKCRNTCMQLKYEDNLTKSVYYELDSRGEVYNDASTYYFIIRSVNSDKCLGITSTSERNRINQNEFVHLDITAHQQVYTSTFIETYIGENMSLYVDAEWSLEQDNTDAFICVSMEQKNIDVEINESDCQIKIYGGGIRTGSMKLEPEGEDEEPRSLFAYATLFYNKTLIGQVTEASETVSIEIAFHVVTDMGGYTDDESPDYLSKVRSLMHIYLDSYYEEYENDLYINYNLPFGCKNLYELYVMRNVEDITFYIALEQVYDRQGNPSDTNEADQRLSLISVYASHNVPFPNELEATLGESHGAGTHYINIDFKALTEEQMKSVTMIYLTLRPVGIKVGYSQLLYSVYVDDSASSTNEIVTFNGDPVEMNIDSFYMTCDYSSAIHDSVTFKNIYSGSAVYLEACYGSPEFTVSNIRPLINETYEQSGVVWNMKAPEEGVGVNSNDRLDIKFSGALQKPIPESNVSNNYFISITDFFAIRKNNLCGAGSPLTRFGIGAIKAHYIVRLAADETRPIQVNDEIRIIGSTANTITVEVDRSTLSSIYNDNSKHRLQYAIYAMEEDATRRVFDPKFDATERLYAAFASPVPQTACGMNNYGQRISKWKRVSVEHDEVNSAERKNRVVSLDSEPGLLKAGKSYYINVLVASVDERETNNSPEDGFNQYDKFNHAILAAYHVRSGVSLNMKKLDSAADYSFNSEFGHAVSHAWIALVTIGTLVDVAAIIMIIIFFLRKKGCIAARKKLHSSTYNQFMDPSIDTDNNKKDDYALFDNKDNI